MSFSIQCVLTRCKEPILGGVSDLIKFRFGTVAMWAVGQALASIFGIAHHIAPCVQLSLGVGLFCECQRFKLGLFKFFTGLLGHDINFIVEFDP